jgi:YfiH family protein
MTAVVPRLDEHPVPGPIPRYQLDEWSRRYGLVAGITGRGDGFNLGLLTAGSAEPIVGRWRELFVAFRSQFGTYVVGLQTHETRIAVHHQPPEGWIIRDAVDGHATRTPGVLLTATVADCVPVYLAHPGTGAVALLHAGWRGLASGMLEGGVSTLCQLANASVKDVVIHCGVAICGQCYEVGPEVQFAVLGTPRPAGPLDLRAALADRARALGVGAVTASGWCSAHDADRFYSHRRSSGQDGRMLAYLGVPRA